MSKGGKEVLLVTGGSGLVGHAMRDVMDEFVDTRGWKLVWLSSHDANLKNFDEAKKVFEEHTPTVVVHLAARVGGLFANMSDQIGFFRDNMAINDNVVTLCHQFTVRKAVFCLSTCVFPAEASLPLTEESLHLGPPHFSNEGYAMSKRMLECLVRWYRQKFDYEWVCVVPTNLYGPHDNFNLKDAHVLPALMHKCRLAKDSDRPFVIGATGKPLRQFLFSKDAGRIILHILLSKNTAKTLGNVILCADAEEEYSIEDAARMLAKAMKFDGPVEFNAAQAEGVYRKTASNAKLRAFLPSDFKFTTLEEGLEETARWFDFNFEKGEFRK